MGKTNSNVDPNTEPTESWREKTIDPKEVKGIDTSSGEDYSTDSDYSEESTQLGDLREADYYTPGQSAISKISGTKVDIGAVNNNLTVSAAAAAQFTPVDIAKGIRDPNERARYIAEQGSKMTDLMDGVVGIKFDDEIADYAKYRQNQYDSKVSKFLDDLDENQGFWKGLGNFGGKLLGLTATSLSQIIPAVYGIGSAIINMDGKKLYDNGAYDAWASMDKNLNEYFVVYGGDSYTSGEEKNVFARFMDNPMKSLADDFAPTIAFVAGAVGTSYITGGVGALQASKGISYINGLSKASAKTNLVFKNGVKWARGIKNFEDVAEYSNFVNKYSKGLGTINQMVLSASYESALIARDTKNSTSLNSKINYIKDNPELAKEYDALVLEHMDEFGNMDKTQEELVEEISKKIPKNLLRQMEYASEQAGNLAFFTNVPLVGASNLIQFSKAFNTSYKAGQSLITKTSMNPLKGVVKTAEGKLATAASQASKFKKVVGYTGIVLKPGLTEAFEEFSQGVIEKGYSDYYALEFKDGAIQDTKDFLKSIGSQASLYANSVEGFDSVALGFLMGIVGLPLGINRDSKTGKTKVGFGFTGGVKESIQEFREELRRTDSAVSHYNASNFNEVVKNNLNAAIKQIQIQKDLDKYAEEENIFDYKNAEFQSIYNFIENRIKNEIGETVFQDIDALEDMSLKEFNENFAFKEDAMQFTEKTKKQAIKSMRSTAESIVKAHEDVNNVLNYKRGFIDNIFKTDFDGLSNEDQMLTESLTDQMKFLYASGLNIRKREEELTQRMSDLTKGKLNVSELGVKLRSKVEVKEDGKTKKKEDSSGLLSQELAGIDKKTGKATFADQVAELKKMIKDQIKFDRETEIEYNKNSVEIDQIVEDVVKLRDMESKTWEIYKTLFTPKGAKKFAEINSQLVIYKAIELQKAQAEEQKEELAKKKSSVGASKVAANATSTNNQFIVEEKLQQDLQKVDTVTKEERQKLLKNKNSTDEDTANSAIKILESVSPLLFAKIKEIATNSEEYSTIFSDEVIDVIQGNADPETIAEDRTTTFKILNQLIKENKEANNKPIVTLDYANEEDNKPFVNSVTPTPGSTKENHNTNTHLSLKERLEKLREKQQGKNYVKEKTTASDKTTILMYSDKIGKTGLIPDGEGGYIAVNKDMPITEASNKKVNDGTFLSNEELKDNNVRATFKLVEDSPFIEELKAENNYNETTAPIDVYYGDTFIGRLPGSSELSTPEQLKNLRKALFKQLTADEAVSQEAPGVYTGYQSTVAPKTEFEKKNERRLNKHKTDLKEATTVKEKAQAISNFRKHKAALEKRGGTISKEDTALFDSAEQELNEQGIKIDGIKAGDVFITGTIIEIDNATDPDNIKDLNLDNDFIVQEIANIIEPQIVTEGKQTQRAKIDTKLRVKTLEEIKSNIKSLEKTIEALKKLSKDTSVEEKLIEKFNERIVQLEQTPAPKTETKETTAQNIETKKADIEKRRQEELDRKKKYVSSQKAADSGKGEFKTITLEEIDLKASGLLEEDGSKIKKIIVLEERGRNSENKRVGTIRILYDDGPVNYEVFFNDDKINAKYDAELAALETTSPETNAEIEAKKKQLGIEKVVNIYPPYTRGLDQDNFEFDVKREDGTIMRLTALPGDPKYPLLFRATIKNNKGTWAQTINGKKAVPKNVEVTKNINEYLPKELVSLLEGTLSIQEQFEKTDEFKSFTEDTPQSERTQKRLDFEKSLLDTLKPYTDLFQKNILEAELKSEQKSLDIYKARKETELNNKKITRQEARVKKIQEQIAALETTSPETEVEQTAREKVIEENFEDIIKALTANPIMQGDEFIGEKKC